MNQYGLVVGWDCGAANVADNTFQWLIRQVDGRMIVLSDTGFHAAEGDPSNLKLCRRGEWEDRILVETVLSMLTLVCHLKKVTRVGACCTMSLSKGISFLAYAWGWHSERTRISSCVQFGPLTKFAKL